MPDISRRNFIASGIGLAVAGTLPGCGGGGGGTVDTTCASAVFPQPREFASASGLLNFPMNIFEETNTVGTPAQDNVLVTIIPGAALTYNYDLPADHPAGTMWYPHTNMVRRRCNSSAACLASSSSKAMRTTAI